MLIILCRSKVEILKEQSDFLRHPLMEELVTEEPNINEGALQLMKFHGSYQQDDRDKRGFGKGKAYQFMMRTRQPGGLVSNQLYLTMDDLADQVCVCRHLSASNIRLSAVGIALGSRLVLTHQCCVSVFIKT